MDFGYSIDENNNIIKLKEKKILIKKEEIKINISAVYFNKKS